MTNKMIIIDGVDVSGCDYIIPPKKQCPMKAMPYAKEASCIACKKHNTKHNFCKNNPNCDYKQLQRLTAQYNAVVEQNKSLQTELKQKEQECEELKEELKDSEQRALNKYIENNIQCVLPSNCIYVNRYKQAFGEIENKINSLHYNTLIFHSGSTHRIADRIQETKNQILEIINKAKEVNNAG